RRRSWPSRASTPSSSVPATSRRGTRPTSGSRSASSRRPRPPSSTCSVFEGAGMMEPEIIQRFLESVGQKADIDLYLKLFRAQKKESFAIIAADAQIVKSALDPFHFDLRILTGLGLVPVVILGLYEGREADRQATRVQEWLVEDAVPARILPSGP